MLMNHACSAILPVPSSTKLITRYTVLEGTMRPLISKLDLVVVVSLTTLACGGPSGLPGQEPFDAILPATVWLEATGGHCPGLTGTVTGSGEATPGGAFTFEASHCLDTSRVVVDSFIQLTDGQFAFNFASGATLTGTHNGYLFLKETGLYNTQADLWFTGGTGQFAHPGAGGGHFAQVTDSAPMLDRQTGQATKVRFEGVYYP